jgi:uracil phosphoribosyltransferase
MHPDFPNLNVIKHPLMQHKLTFLRREETSTAGFRRRVKEISQMLATGNSAVAALICLKKYGVSSGKFVCLLAAPEGVRNLLNHHPDVGITRAALDERLNEHGYIVPGLGDAGNRLFGTR